MPIRAGSWTEALLACSLYLDGWGPDGDPRPRLIKLFFFATDIAKTSETSSSVFFFKGLKYLVFAHIAVTRYCKLI